MHHGHVVVGDERAGRLAQRAISVGDPRIVQQFQGRTKLPDPSALQRRIDERLSLGLTTLRVESFGKVQGPDVERVQSQGLGQQTFCLVHAAEPPEQHDAQSRTCSWSGRARRAAVARSSARSSRPCRASMIAIW